MVVSCSSCSEKLRALHALVDEHLVRIAEYALLIGAQWCTEDGALLQVAH